MVDPFTIFFGGKALLVLLGLGAAGALLIFWPQIMEVVRNIVLPFFEDIDPRLRDVVADAFMWVDKNVAVPIRARVVRAWRDIRSRIIGAVARYSRNSDSNWVREISVYLNQDDNISVRRVKEDIISYDEVPEEIRENYMRSNFNGWSKPVDITKARDSEIEAMEISLET
jgi:hypothetical protein